MYYNDTTNRVGIGVVSNPDEKLHIVNDTTSANVYEKIQSTSGGIVGIKLQRTAASDAYTDYNIYDSGGSLYFESNNATATTTRLFVADTTGNVGVGTSTPQDKLEVAGDINASGGGNYVRGTATGVTTATTCGSGQYLPSLKIDGGIVTNAGPCTTERGSGGSPQFEIDDPLGVNFTNACNGYPCCNIATGSVTPLASNYANNNFTAIAACNARGYVTGIVVNQSIPIPGGLSTGSTCMYPYEPIASGNTYSWTTNTTSDTPKVMYKIRCFK